MLIEEAVMYLVLFVLGSAIGIPFGSWLNSKLLTRTWKGELDRARKEISESEEYRTAMELISNLNELMNSEEARNFFANATKALVTLTGKPKDNEPVFEMPKKGNESPSESSAEG